MTGKTGYTEVTKGLTLIDKSVGIFFSDKFSGSTDRTLMRTVTRKPYRNTLGNGHHYSEG